MIKYRFSKLQFVIYIEQVLYYITKLEVQIMLWPDITIYYDCNIMTTFASRICLTFLQETIFAKTDFTLVFTIFWMDYIFTWVFIYAKVLICLLLLQGNYYI